MVWLLVAWLAVAAAFYVGVRAGRAEAPMPVRTLSCSGVVSGHYYADGCTVYSDGTIRLRTPAGMPR